MYYPLKMVANIPMSAVPPSVGVNHAPAEKLPDDSAEKGGWAPRVSSISGNCIMLFSLVSNLGKLELTECSEGVQNENGWITADSLEWQKATASRSLHESSSRQRPEKRVGVLCTKAHGSSGDMNFSGAFAVLFWCKCKQSLLISMNCSSYGWALLGVWSTVPRRVLVWIPHLSSVPAPLCFESL